MKVIFVGAGPGDPELLTRKAERLLRSCNCCIYAGSLVSPEVLSLIPPTAATYDSAAMTLDQTTAVCADARQQGVDVIRLHTGDPSIYGAIQEQMDKLDELGIDYEVVPGVSSFQAAAAALKTELTAPEVSQTIILTRTSGRTPMPSEQELHEIARTKSTLCLFLSVHKISEIAQTLADYYGAKCPAAVIYRASWPDQITVTGTLETIAADVQQAAIKKTAMILVGWALARNGVPSKLYDPDFSHGYRRGERPS